MTTDPATIERMREEEAVIRLRGYVAAHGAMHEDDCPGDDTCSCALKPVNDAVELVCEHLPSLLSDASRVQELDAKARELEEDNFSARAYASDMERCSKQSDDRVSELERQLAVAVGALREIGKQRTVKEWDKVAEDEGFDPDSADYTGAYDACVRTARSALAKIEGDRPGADTIPA